MNASEVLDRYWDGCLPVDVVGIAQRMGLSVESVDVLDNGASGEIEQAADGSFVIRFVRAEPEVRQRFTVAHEIGHFALGHLRGSQRMFRDSVADFSTGARGLERQANAFAAALLMPARIVEYVLAHKDIASDAALARHFAVSGVALKYRLRDLGLTSI
jgi:Zn-dependent peptidase ImmA (M78 family)